MVQPTEEERLEFVKSYGVEPVTDINTDLTFKDVGTAVAEMTPIIGDAMAAKEIYDELQKEDPDYRFIAVLGGAGLIGAIPGIGDVAAKGIRNAADMIKRIEVDPDALGSLGGNVRLKPKETEYDAMIADLDKAETIDEWQTNAKALIKEGRVQDPVIRTPELEDSTRQLLEGKITRDQHLANVDEFKPVSGYDQLPREPSDKAVVFGLNDAQRKDGHFLIGDADGLNVNKSSIKIGDDFNGRLDIPAYNAYDVWIVTGNSKQAEKGKHYLKAVHYEATEDKPVRFIASERTSERIGTGEKGKTPYATVAGRVKDLDVEKIRSNAAELLDDPEWTQVGFDPRRQGGFYVRTGENKHVPVREATEVIQIGPLVLAKNAKLDLEYQGYSEGGMAIEEQMAMNFGDVPDNTIGQDPVSGNDIPLGSTAENVRDDIPTNLSEGEIVVPADVVNFHGVKLFEDLRAEAKMGYAQMANDGRIGGEPMDDIPDMDIELSELDLEVMDDQAPVQMNRGGTSMKDYKDVAKNRNIKTPKRTAPRKTHAEIMAQAFGSNTDSRKDNSPSAISSRVQARKNKPKNRFEAIRQRLKEVFDGDNDRRVKLTQKPRTSDDIGPSIADQINFGGKGFDFRNNQSPTPPPPQVRQSNTGAGGVPYKEDEPLNVRYYDQPFYKRLMEGLGVELKGFDEGGLATDEDTNLIGGEDQFNQPFYAEEQKGGFDMDNAYTSYGDGTSGGPLLEMREYMNDDGHRIFITFIDGVPQMEIPAGYYPVEGEGTVVAPTPAIGGGGGSDSGGSGGGGSAMPTPTPVNYKELSMEELTKMVEDQKKMTGNAISTGISAFSPLIGGAMKVAMWNETRKTKAEIQRRRDDPATSEVDKRRYDQLLEIANKEEPGLISTLFGKLTGNDLTATEAGGLDYNQLDKMTKAYTPDVQDASNRTSRGFTPGVDDAISTARPAATTIPAIPEQSTDADAFDKMQDRFDIERIEEDMKAQPRPAPRTATRPIREESPRVQQVRKNTQKVMKDMRDRGASREERNASLKAAARTENVVRDLDRGIVRGFHKGALVDKPKVKKVVKGLKKASKTHAKQADQLEGMVKKKSK